MAAARTPVLSCSRDGCHFRRRVVALMAEDILEARAAHPVFATARCLAGNLEPHYLALGFGLFGPSSSAFRCVRVRLPDVLSALTRLLRVPRSPPSPLSERAACSNTPLITSLLASTLLQRGCSRAPETGSQARKGWPPVPRQPCWRELEMEARVRAHVSTSEYALVFDLVDEPVVWFEAAGVRPGSRPRGGRPGAELRPEATMRVTLLNLLSGMQQATRFPSPIYDFGALRVPGQEHLPFVREFFPGQPFVGCDLRDGPGVDEIQDLHALNLADGTVGTALLFDTIEHVREPWRAMARAPPLPTARGLLVLTSVWYFPIHAYPDDYWPSPQAAFVPLLGDAFHPIALGMCGMPRLPHTVFGIASREGPDPEVERALLDAVAAWQRHGAHSWKETIQAIMPPVLLIPSYDLFLRVARLLFRRRRPASRSPNPALVVAETRAVKGGWGVGPLGLVSSDSPRQLGIAH